MKNITVATTAEELSKYRETWHDLALHAVERNVFYEPCSLIPALRHLSHDSVEVVLVWGSLNRVAAGGEHSRSLIGLFPIHPKVRHKRIPIRSFGLWRHTHCFLCVPLVRLGHEGECLKAFLAWLEESGRCPLFFEFNDVTADGAFHEALCRFARDGTRSIDDFSGFARAFLKSSLDGEHYLNAALPARRRKDLRRKFRLLEEQGAVRTAVLGPQDDADAWMERFFALERSGWKGEAGTAIAVHDGEKHYFQEMTQHLFAEGRLICLMMTLNGKPIAMKYNVIAGEGAFAIKIAFDEGHAKSSPGLLLEIENLRHMLSRTDVTWMDSCASPDNEMINRLWQERRTIKDIKISAKPLYARGFLKLVLELRKLYHRLKFAKPKGSTGGVDDEEHGS